jgi:hypothetical protein
LVNVLLSFNLIPPPKKKSDVEELMGGLPLFCGFHAMGSEGFSYFYSFSVKQQF